MNERRQTTGGLPGLLVLLPLCGEGESDIIDILLPIRKLGGTSFYAGNLNSADVDEDTRFNRRNSCSPH